jgi:hypothetical protein
MSIGGALIVTGTIGKKREPVTPGGAIATVIINGAMAGTMIAAGLRL